MKNKPIRTVAQVFKKLAQEGIRQRTSYTGNPVMKFKMVRAPKSLALKMETQRLLNAYKKSFKGKSKTSIAVIKRRAQLNVEAVYKKHK